MNFKFNTAKYMYFIKIVLAEIFVFFDQKPVSHFCKPPPPSPCHFCIPPPPLYPVTSFVNAPLLPTIIRFDMKKENVDATRPTGID